MAVRLSIIICQTPGGSNAQQAREMEFVMALLGAAGVDVHLIGALDPDSLAGTDRLVLESLERDFGILAPFTPEQTLDRLERLGVAGRRGAHADDPNPPQHAPQLSGRRVFCLEHGKYDTGDQLLNAVQSILRDQQVVAVPIGLGAPKGAAGNSDPMAKPAPKATFDASIQTPAADAAATAETSPSPTSEAASQSPESSRTGSPDLDDLVDELNGLTL